MLTSMRLLRYVSTRPQLQFTALTATRTQHVLPIPVVAQSYRNFAQRIPFQQLLTTRSVPFMVTTIGQSSSKSSNSSIIVSQFVRFCASTTKPAAGTTGSRTSAMVEKSKTAMVEKSKSGFEKLKELWRKYGVVAIGTYLTMYGTVLGTMYVAIDQGWVSKKTKQSNNDEQPAGDADTFNVVTTTNQFVAWAEEMGIAQYLDIQRVNSKSGTFLLAWVATKFTEPLRLAITLAITPRVARLLGRVPKQAVTVAKKPHVGNTNGVKEQ